MADGSSGLQIINISNPASPTSLSRFNTASFVLGVSLSKDGNTVYVADSNLGLQILNIGLFNAVEE